MNLENLGVQEMSAQEAMTIEGGKKAKYACPTGNAVADIGVAAWNAGVFIYNCFQ